MTKLVKIGDRLINISNITYIIDRTVHFNNGDKWIALEPELQEILAIMFETPRAEVVNIIEEPFANKKPVLRKKK